MVATTFDVNVRVNSREAEASVRRVRRGLRNVEGQGRRTGRTLDRAFRIASAVILIRQLRQLVDGFTAVRNAIGAVVPDQERLNNTILRLRNIANNTRTELSAIAQLYSRASFVADEFGGTNEELFRFIELTGKALAVQGVSANQARGALIQLSQALGQTAVRAEEFNSLQEGAPQLLLAAARGIDRAGGSFARLRTLVVQGQISNREFFDGILRGAGPLDEAFARTTATIGQAFTRLGNSLTVFIGRVDESEGISETFAQAIIFIADQLERFEGVGREVLRFLTNLAIVLGPAVLFGAVRALFALLASNPFTLIATTVATLITLFPDLQGQFDAFRTSVLEFVTGTDFTGIARSLARALDGALAIARAFGEAFGVIFDNLNARPDAAFALLQRGFRNVADFLINTVLGALTAIGNILRRTFTRFRQLLENVSSIAGAISTGNLAAAQSLADTQTQLARNIISDVSSLPSQISQEFNRLNNSGSFLDSIVGPREDLSNEARDLANLVQSEFNRTLDEAGTPAEDALGRLLGSSPQGIVGVARTVANQSGGGTGAGAGPDIGPAGPARLDSEENRARAEQTINAAQRLNNQLNALDQRTDFGSGVTRGLLRIKQEAEDLAAVGEAIVNVFADQATNALIDFARTGEFNFKEFASSILEELLRIIIRLLVVQALNSAFGGPAQGNADALVGEGITNTGGLGRGLAGLGERESGGRVQPSRSFVVGENGPEIFRPDQGGTIIPNGAPAMAAPEVNLTVVNETSPMNSIDALDTVQGRQRIRNIIRSDRKQIRQILQ
jgi:tape measure domain-containing protein